MAKELSVLKPRSSRLKNVNFFLSFSYYGFEDTHSSTENISGAGFIKKFKISSTLSKVIVEGGVSSSYLHSVKLCSN